jgi:hypothetical protein
MALSSQSMTGHVPHPAPQVLGGEFRRRVTEVDR